MKEIFRVTCLRPTLRRHYKRSVGSTIRISASGSLPLLLGDDLLVTDYAMSHAPGQLAYHLRQRHVITRVIPLIFLRNCSTCPVSHSTETVTLRGSLNRHVCSNAGNGSHGRTCFCCLHCTAASPCFYFVSIGYFSLLF